MSGKFSFAVPGHFYSNDFMSFICRNKNEIIFYLIESISKIIETSRVHSLISLKTISVILLKEIYNDQSNSVESGLSEELKLAIVNCVEVAVRRSSYEVIEQFYTKENLIFIAQMLSVCVELINKETYRQLKFVLRPFFFFRIISCLHQIIFNANFDCRMASIKCIMSLMCVHDEADFEDIVLRNQIADVVFILLPKLVTTLIQIATGDETQGHALIAVSSLQ